MSTHLLWCEPTTELHVVSPSAIEWRADTWPCATGGETHPEASRRHA